MLKKIIWLLLLFALVIIVLPKIISRLSLMLAPSNQDTNEQDSSYLLPPELDPLPEATNSATIDISGYANNAVDAELYINDLKKQTQNIDKTGSFNFANVRLYNGNNSIYIISKSNDSKSNKSKTVIIMYSSDTPKLQIISPEDLSEFKGNDQRALKIEGFSDSDNEITINGRSVVVNTDGSFSYTYRLSDGENKLTITARNAGGNSTEIVRTVTYSP